MGCIVFRGRYFIKVTPLLVMGARDRRHSPSCLPARLRRPLQKSVQQGMAKGHWFNAKRKIIALDV